MPRSLVVVPTYNEAGNLPTLVAEVFAAGDYELLVVDDASPDGTGKVAEELAEAHDGRLSVVHRARKEGLGPAYVEGFKWALAGPYEYIFQMDADLSHDPRVLNDLRVALEHADLVIGSRYVAGGGTVGWPWRRRVLSSWGSQYARLLLGLPVQDVTGGYKGFRRPALEALDLNRVGARGFGFQIEVTYYLCRAGYRVVEVPIVFVDRRVGTSKMSWPIVAEALILPWHLLLADWRSALAGPGAPDGNRVLRSLLSPLRLLAGGRVKNNPLA